MPRAFRSAVFFAVTLTLCATTADARRRAPQRSSALQSSSLRTARLLRAALGHPQRQQQAQLQTANPLKPPIESLPKVSLLTNTPQTNAPAKHRYSIASFNVENLFAFRRNSSGVSEREARYLPKSTEQYQAKLAKVAEMILSPMGKPEIVAVQEIENRAGVNVLGDLVKEIKRQSGSQGVEYGYAISSGRADERGISQGFLYRKDRVQPLPGQPQSYDKTVGGAIANDGAGPNLMRRPLLVGGFKIFRDGVRAGGPAEQIVVANQHLKSRPDTCIERRQAQAKFTGSYVKGLIQQNCQARVIVAGDFNADFNQSEHRNQIGGLEQLGQQGLLSNLTAKLGAGERFSYRYKGRPQLLDWMYASKPLSQQLVELRIPHVNSVKPRDQRASDHDPVIATFAGAFKE